jgi:hypothetical protein
LLLLVVLIETSFLELDILHINIRSTSEWYGGSKDELGAVRLETMTLEVGFPGKQLYFVTSVLEIMSPLELTGCVSSSLVTAETLFFLLLRLKTLCFWVVGVAAD